jgi:hypothetical protein
VDYDPDEIDYGTEGRDDEDDFDCHMGPDGQCGAAGSEMCDFECPVMAAIHRENYAVRKKYLDEQAAERAQAQEREFAGRQLLLPL